MAITQSDIARQLGISQMTVSRCLRGTPGTSQAMQNAVLKAARQHGYSLDDHFEAGALQRRRNGGTYATSVVCFIVWDTHEDAGFNRRILEGLCEGAVRCGSEVIVAPKVLQELPRVVRRKQVDGVVRLLGDTDIERMTLECPVPWVSILHDIEPPDVVTVDHRAATLQLGRHLGRLGHRRFAFMGPDSTIARQRIEGLRTAAAEFGGALPDQAVWLSRHDVAFSKADALAAAFIDRLVVANHGPRVSVLAAYNDWIAVALVHALRAKGIRVPQDVSVVGFDGALPLLPGSEPPLTTVALPLVEMGIEAAQLLVWRIRHPGAPRRRRVLRTRLIKGETVARPNQRAIEGSKRRRNIEIGAKDEG